MNLISYQEAVKEYEPALQRLKKARKTLVQCVRNPYNTSGHVPSVVKDITATAAEMRAALEWFGEVCFIRHGATNDKIFAAIEAVNKAEKALRFEAEHESSLDNIVDAFAQLRAEREALYKLLASYGERWFDNG